MNIDNLQNAYDIVLVGGGIANISLALQLINSDKSVLLIELGKDIDSRVCPKHNIGTCVSCNPCNITSGFSGAGCFSDCKLSYSSEVGGYLIDYIGAKKFEELLTRADDMFISHGAKQPKVSGGDYADKLAYNCLRYGMKLIKGDIRHLGTDGSYEVMTNIRSKIANSSNITVLCKTKVVAINCRENFIECVINKAECRRISYGKICVAVGRSGSDWLRSQCIDNDIQVEEGKQLFFDSYSSRYFESTMEDVLKAEYDLNRDLTLEDHVTLNRFYEYLGLDRVDGGDEIGWSTGANFALYWQSWIDFSHQKTEIDDDLECYIISFYQEPYLNFEDY